MYEGRCCGNISAHLGEECNVQKSIDLHCLKTGFSSLTPYRGGLAVGIINTCIYCLLVASSRVR